MKKMKKFASILLALVMAMALTVPAFAEGETEKTITINNKNEGHVYGAYQIFVGDVDVKSEGEGEAAKTIETLSNVQWGKNIEADQQAMLISELNLVDTATARDVAEEIARTYKDRGAELADLLNKYISGEPVSTAKVPVDGQYTLTVVPGYYLIKDISDVVGNDAKTDFILEVVGNATVSPKNSDTPTPDKEVLDTNDSTKDPADAWDDSADHDVGDTINYRLTATLPTSYTAYKHYKLKFVDTMDKGLTYNDDAKVYVVNSVDGNETKTEIVGLADAITSSTDAAGKTTLTVSLDDLKAESFADYNIVAGSKIVVEYTATLNENAVFKNKNEMHLEFSNDPNWDDVGEPPTGTSENVTTVVFTYSPIVNKVDGEKNELAGAEFTLYKWDPNVEGTDKWVKLDNAVPNDKSTSFSFKGIDDGVYKLVESKTPAGYNTAADILFGVKATHTNTDDDPSLTVHDVTWREDTNIWSFADEQKTDFTIEIEAGTISTDVVNETGALMPETGGIGTTIFYTLGGLMVVAAGVLLVTKRRMQSKG